MALGVPKKPHVIRWNSSRIRRHFSTRGDTAEPLYVSLLVPVGMANRGSRQFCFSVAFRHSTGFLVDLGGETAATPGQSSAAAEHRMHQKPHLAFSGASGVSFCSGG